MREIVYKIEDDIDPKTVTATTYQMRNPFRQFADGVAGELDTHCYFQHAAAADLCPVGGRVLDVCCGRGLLIPFIRYRAKPSLYCGVDIEPKNARWKDGADPRREKEQKTDWGFDRVFVESNVGNMAEPVRNAIGPEPFDLVVYTSAIEHMQIDDQKTSLMQAAELSRDGAYLYLSFPVTEPGRDGYDTQYAAHVYEPKETEIRDWLKSAGWIVKRRIGLCTKTGVFKKKLNGANLRGAEYINGIQPRAQALCTIAALYPDAATELAYICQKKVKS